MTAPSPILDIRADDAPTIAEILRGERTWRVPVALQVARTQLQDHDLVGLSIDEVMHEARATDRPKTKKGQEFDIEIVASTDKLVRDNGIVPLHAWELEEFLANPVILFAHMSFMPPIAQAVGVELKRALGELREFWRFNDITQLSREVHTLFELGDMRAASVGFMVKQFHRPDEAELKKLRKKFPEANEFTFMVDRAILVETSAVPVPSDPGALAVTGRSIEDDLADLYTELGLRGAGDRQVFALGGIATDVDPATAPTPPEFVEVRAHWAAARAFLKVECDRGNSAACRCLTEGGHDVSDPNTHERTPIPFSVHAKGSYGIAPRSATWSGPAEVRKMPNDAAALRVRHAWRAADGDDDAKSTYKFPHHRAADNKAVVFRALAAGFARLDQADIPEGERDGVAAHLGKHMRDDFDAEPPERALVADLFKRIAGIFEKHGADLSSVIREALPLVFEFEGTFAKLGGGEAAAGFDVVIAEAKFRAGVGPDPLVTLDLEIEDDDDQVVLLGLDDQPIEFED